MRRFLIMIFILFLSAGCWSLTYLTNQSPSASVFTFITHTSTVIPPSPTSTTTPSSTPTTVPTSTPTTTSPSPIGTFTTIYHPDDQLYVGDQISIEVISPPGLDLKAANLKVQVDPPDGQFFDPISFSPWGIQGRDEATLLWVWNTQDQDPGKHTLAFSIQPNGYAWVEQITLLPSGDMPPNQAEASWASVQNTCCTVFYITNTASERDISTLTTLIDEQANLAFEAMDFSISLPITITVLPRLLGHGGFSSNEISVSYLDRNYAANSWVYVVRHELIHELDSHLGGDFRPTIFIEGLAVYKAGGHYKPEALMPRTAALLEGYLNWYIPLKSLSDDFYASQHEIGYMEAGALIEYLVRVYGWDAFSAFYRDIHINPGETQSQAIDAALKVHFSTSLDQLEQDFLTALSQEQDSSLWVQDVRLTVTYFDIMRRYQQLLDPSAYFRTAWLLDNQTMRERGIVADYLRHPSSPENLALETLFITASRQLFAQQYQDTARTLEIIDSILDAIELGSLDPFSISPLAADFLSIASTLKEFGYEVQNIEMDQDSATVNAYSASGPVLIELVLTRSSDGWSLLP